MLYSLNEGRNFNTWLQKYNSLYSSWSQNFCGERQTDGQTETSRNRGRRMETSILTYDFLAALLDAASMGCQALAVTLREWPKFFWPLAETDFRLRLYVLHIGIYIYHFITPIHFRSTTWRQPLIYTGVSCAEKSLTHGYVRGQYTTGIVDTICL